MAETIDFDLGPDYIDIRPLDEGGMGTLYRAYRRGLGVDVVIKRIKSKYLGKLDQKGEANILKLLKHRYLPRIYDFISGDDGYFYTVMDYIPGVNMQSYVRSNGAADQKLTHKWATQLCEVVAYLHEQDPPILHCDIKPSNIMITPEGNICLIDFNTSLIFSDGVLALGATPGYAAPEQYRRDPRPAAGAKPDPAASTASPASSAADPFYRDLTEAATDRTSYAGTARDPELTEAACSEAAAVSGPAEASRERRSSTPAVPAGRAGSGQLTRRTDVYGIGATLYFLVTGKAPEKSLGPVTPVTAYPLRIGKPLQSIILRAMEKEPEKRFSSAQEMLRALNDVDLMDSRLRRYTVTKRLVVTALLLLWAGSAASTLYGWKLMRDERVNQYLSLVTQGTAYADAGDYEQGKEVLRQAIDMTPSRSEAYTSLATLLYQQGQYQEAISTVEDVLAAGVLDAQQDTEPYLADLYYIEAACRYELAQYEQAVTLYKKAAKGNAENTACIRGLAMAQARCGDLEAAQDTLSALEALDVDAADCDIVRAEIYTMQGDTANALDSYRKAADRTDDAQLLSHAYLAGAQLYKQTGDLAGGAAFLEEAMQAHPEAVGTVHLEQLADLYSTLAEQEPTAGYYEKALSLWQDLADRPTATAVTGINLAALEQKMGNYEGALATLQALLEKYPYDYRIDMRLAYLYADWQSRIPAENRDYHPVEAYYKSANEKYAQAVANGQEDQDMELLENMVKQLQDAGWL